MKEVIVIDITGLDKADVLAALYNRAVPQGLGFAQYDPAPMTRAEAEELLSKRSNFDYIKGRALKVELVNPLDPSGFDKRNGPAAALLAITELRLIGNPASDAILFAHRRQLAAAIEEAEKSMATPTEFSENGVYLGLAEAASELRPYVERARKSIE